MREVEFTRGIHGHHGQLVCVCLSLHGACPMIVWSGDGSTAKTAALSSALNTLSRP